MLLHSQAWLIAFPFETGNKDFSWHSLFVCGRDASNLLLRVTAHHSWQLSSDGHLVKSRTLLLELGIVPELHCDFWAAVQMSALVERESKVDKDLMSFVPWGSQEK